MNPSSKLVHNIRKRKSTIARLVGELPSSQPVNKIYGEKLLTDVHVDVLRFVRDDMTHADILTAKRMAREALK